MRERNTIAIKKDRRMLFLIGPGGLLAMYLIGVAFFQELDLVPRAILGMPATFIAAHGWCYLYALWYRRLKVAKGGPDTCAFMVLYAPLVKLFGLPDR